MRLVRTEKTKETESLGVTLTETRLATMGPPLERFASEPMDRFAKAESSPLFNRARLPGRALTTLRTLEQRNPAWSKASSLVRECCAAGGTVLIHGARWTGKTLMAVSLAVDYLADRKGAVYSKGIGLLLDLRMNHNQNDSASREVIRPYEMWHLLIVDEIGLRIRGEQGYSDSDAALLTDLIDKRYDGYVRGTIFLSNEDIKVTAEKLGPSIMRRIEETGMIIPVTWKPFGDAT